MEVLIDDQIFLLTARGGIARYFAELLREFGEHPDWGVHAVTSVRWSPNLHLQAVDPSVRPIRLNEGSLAWDVARRAARYDSSRQQRRLYPDVVHSTYYLPDKLDHINVPHIVTIHDMAPELLGGVYADAAAHMAKRDYLEHADAIICVSQSTRDDLFNVWGEITDRPVIVTHHAVSERFNPDVAPADLGFDYLLYVGTRRDGYKNVDLLLQAFAGSAAQDQGVRLLLVGGGPLLESEWQRAVELGIANDVEQRDVSEDDLPGVYRAAVALVYPSRLEGFGIPVLEAMSVGTPVVLADTAVFHEVAADAGLFVDPSDPADLRAQLDELVTDPGLVARLRAAGLKRADQFSWEQTARTTAALYREVVGTEPRGRGARR